MTKKKNRKPKPVTNKQQARAQRAAIRAAKAKPKTAIEKQAMPNASVVKTFDIEVVRASDLQPEAIAAGDAADLAEVKAHAEVFEAGVKAATKRKGKLKLEPAPKMELVASGAPINKRITPGAHVDEWRIARSLRVGKPGFFLQGGYIEKKNGKKFFRVAEEEYFKSLHDAKKAHVAKLPEAVAVGESDEVKSGPVERHIN